MRTRQESSTLADMLSLLPVPNHNSTSFSTVDKRTCKMSNQYHSFGTRTTSIRALQKFFLPSKWGVRFKRQAFHVPYLMHKLFYRSMGSELRMIARPASSAQFVLAQPSDRRLYLTPPVRVINFEEYHTNGRCTVREEQSFGAF